MFVLADAAHRSVTTPIKGIMMCIFGYEKNSYYDSNSKFLENISKLKLIIDLLELALGKKDNNGLYVKLTTSNGYYSMILNQRLRNRELEFSSVGLLEMVIVGSLE